MHPWLIRAGPLSLPSYFALLMVGFLLAIWLARREARRAGMDPTRIIDLGILMLFAGLLGARLLHVLAEDNPETGEPIIYWYLRHPWVIPMFWRGGLAYYGGFILALLCGIWFVRRHRMGVWRVGDLAGFAIPLGLVFGRIGCLLNGCCHGKVSSLPWAMRFPRSAAAYFEMKKLGLVEGGYTLPVHPTQVYSILYNLLLFLFLYFYLWPRRRFDGQVFWTFILLYAPLRFFQEFLRDDNRGLFFGDTLSTSQLISIPLFLLALYLLYYLRKQGRRAVDKEDRAAESTVP